VLNSCSRTSLPIYTRILPILVWVKQSNFLQAASIAQIVAPLPNQQLLCIYKLLVSACLVGTLQEPSAQNLARKVSNVLTGKLTDVEAEDKLHIHIDNVFVEMISLAADAGLLAFSYDRNHTDTTSGTTGKYTTTQYTQQAQAFSWLPICSVQ
jgi:hypothetical protein